MKKKHYNNSIGVYCKFKEEGECSPIELHMNMWSVKGNTNKGSFNAIDFGIKFPLNVASILLILPFKIDNPQQNVYDLGQRLSENTDLLSTVFNENYQAEVLSDIPVSIVRNKKREIEFGIYKLNHNSSLKFKQNAVNNSFTEIVIEPQRRPRDFRRLGIKELYVRFQIRLTDAHHPFRTNENVSNDFIESAFSSSHLYDIRINDIRAIDPDVVEPLGQDNFEQAIFSKIHYFYMSEITEAVDNGSRLHLDTRILEPCIWNKYLLDHEELKGQHISYHWKKTNKEQNYVFSFAKFRPYIKPKTSNKDFESFTLFYKTTYKNINKYRVLCYSAFIVLLGVISSAMVSSITSLFPSSPISTPWVILAISIIVCFVIIKYFIR